MLSVIKEAHVLLEQLVVQNSSEGPCDSVGDRLSGPLDSKATDEGHC